MAPLRAKRFFGGLLAFVVALSVAMPPVRGVRRLARARSPYGVYSVQQIVVDGSRMRQLLHGRTVHGMARVRGAGGDDFVTAEAIGYYHPAGPFGDLFRTLPRPTRVGIVGLGCGGLLAHLAEGDRAVFYEIDPEIERLARTHFRFLEAAQSDVEVVIGDARRSLERSDEVFDMLFLDAFSGDAVPVHLLTRDAFDLYRARLAPNGVLVAHVSNRIFDLRPAVLGAARHLGLDAVWMERTEFEPLETIATVVALGPRERLEPLRQAGWQELTTTLNGRARVLTDDRASLLPMAHW